MVQIDLSNNVKHKLQILYDHLIKWLTSLKHSSLFEVVSSIVNETGLLSGLKTDQQDNIYQWMESLKSFKDLDQYLNAILWSEDFTTSTNLPNVQLLTIH